MEKSKELENDESQFFFTWENIEGSEDYILLEELGYDYEDDNYDSGTYASIMTFLQDVTPHIRWRYAFNGSDRHGASPCQWRVIVVPQDQLIEAQYVFDRYLRGDDLSTYCYTDRYPEIYEKLQHKESKIKDNISSLYSLFSKYEELLFNFNKVDIVDFLESLSSILPQIYFLAQSIPYVKAAPDIEDQGTMSFNKEISLNEFDAFYYFPDPYRNKTQIIRLSKLLLSIYENIEQGLIAFSTNEPDKISAAANDWKFGFSSWGREILIALYAINETRIQIRRKKRTY